MKIKAYFVIMLCFCGFLNAQTTKEYKKLVRKTEKQLNKQIRKQKKLIGKTKMEMAPLEYWRDQYLATLNPKLGYPTPEKIWQYMTDNVVSIAANATLIPGSTQSPWQERGPNNVSGRTRGLMWDPIVNNKVWAGGVTGGLWYNLDITSASSTWVQVSNLWSNLTVTCIAHDPIKLGTMYIGTGEGFGSNASTSRGAGIWKSIDSGKTFTQLSTTTDFYYINDLVVRKEGATTAIYAAVDANFFGNTWHGLSSYGLKRSVNGGTSWSTANIKYSTQNAAIADIEIGPDNRIWLGTRSLPYSVADRGGSRILYSDNGTTFTEVYSNSDKLGRVSLATSKSDSNYVYALIEKGNQLEEVIRTTNRGVNWSTRKEPIDADNGIPSTDFTRGQAWYDLVIAVDPTNKDLVYCGGVDLFKSTDGANSWSHASKWSNNNNLAALNVSLVHADQHAIIFNPKVSNTAIIGNDGGVFYSSNFSSANTSNSAIVSRNKNYNTVQYYWGDIASTSGSNVLIAGAQDNGSQLFTNAGLSSATTVTGGDGAYCFIDNTDNQLQIGSYVYNSYFLTRNSWSNSVNLISDNAPANGSFINPAEWDNNAKGIISNKNGGNLYRRLVGSSTLGTLETVAFGGTNAAKSIVSTRLSNGKSRVWVGNSIGLIYVTDDFWANTPVFASKNSGINVGSISSFFVHNTSDTVLTTLSNYGVNNIYISLNSGTTWTAKDGNLPDVPVWSILLNPNKPAEAIIATELGIFATTNIFAVSVNWQPYTVGMGNVKTTTLRLRKSDNEVLAVTHGRGLFTSGAFRAIAPTADFSANKLTPCSNDTVTLTDASTGDPTTYKWEITPFGKAKYVSGTDSTSKNPKIILKAGTITVKQTVTNSVNSSVKLRTAYIISTDTFLPKVSAIMPTGLICEGKNLVLKSTFTNLAKSEVKNQYWLKNGVLTPFTDSAIISSVVGNSFQIIATTTKVCSLKDSFISASITPTVTSNTTIGITLNNKPFTGCFGKSLNFNVTTLGTANPANVSWYVNNTLKNTGLTYSSSNLINGQELKVVWINNNTCILPKNRVVDSSIVTINAVPSNLNLTLKWDTIFSNYTGLGTIKWFYNGIALTNTQKFNKCLANGNYNATVTEGSCTSDSSNKINFNSLGVTKNKFGIYVYPIPAKEFIHIFSNYALKQIQIYTIAGKLIKTYQLKGLQTKVDVSQYIRGTYLLKLSLANGEKYVEKLIIE